MYISSALHPVNHLDALSLVLDSILDGDDVTLISEGDQGDASLDLAAGCLAGLRCRVLRSAAVLPAGLGVPMPSSAGSAKANVPDDDLLARGYQALTMLDQSCDRIVLLVGDAHTLPHSMLRYIQFVRRSGSHLQLIFCGTRRFLEQLEPPEFAWLRERLMAGLVLTLAAPATKASSTSSSLSTVPNDLAERVDETGVAVPRVPRLVASPRRHRRSSWIGALALLCLCGAAWFALRLQIGPLQIAGPVQPRGIVQAGDANGSATSRPAAAVQAPTTATPPIPKQASGQPVVAVGSPAAPNVQTPLTPGDVLGLSPGSPSSMAPKAPPAVAARALGPASEPTETGISTLGPVAPRPSEPPQNLGRQAGAAAPLRSPAVPPPIRAGRPKDIAPQSAPLPDDGHKAAPEQESSAPQYVGSYAVDASGVRRFHLDP